MFNVRFFSRVAFICNLCFLMAVIMQMMPHPPEGEMVATTIIIGYLFAVIVNLGINFWLAVLYLFTKPLKNSVPRWLIILNFLFLIPELILISK
jgi:hypothetical protein